MRDNGKGDKPRPLSIPMEKFDNNWDAIFKKNQQKVKATVYGVEIEKTKEEWDKIFKIEEK